jgi:hypothetical protein
MTSSTKLRLLAVLTGVSLIVIFCLRPMAQAGSFHNFADARALSHIPNFGNVISNVPFLIIGVAGLVLVFKTAVASEIRITYVLLFLGVLLTGLGSAHYHWNPNNNTLVWDRLPMTIVFMSFLSATVTESVDRQLGTRLLLPLVAVGAGSVIWWHYTETLGRGDLRFYYWVQFYPMVMIPLLLCLFYNPGIRPILPYLVWIVVWYILAKVFEQLDYQIYWLIGISGHTIKHLAAAASTAYFIGLFRRKHMGA